MAYILTTQTEQESFLLHVALAILILCVENLGGLVVLQVLLVANHAGAVMGFVFLSDFVSRETLPLVSDKMQVWWYRD